MARIFLALDWYPHRRDYIRRIRCEESCVRVAMVVYMVGDSGYGRLFAIGNSQWDTLSPLDDYHVLSDAESARARGR